MNVLPMPPQGTVSVEQSTLYSKNQSNCNSGHGSSKRLVGALSSLFGSFKLGGFQKQASERNFTSVSSSSEDDYKQPTSDRDLASDPQNGLSLSSKQVIKTPTTHVLPGESISFHEVSRSSRKEEVENRCSGISFSPGASMEQESCSLEEFKLVIKQLQPAEGGAEIQVKAAQSIRFMAKGSPEARTTLASLGAIPPLVAVLDSSNSSCRSSALLALLNLAICNDNNKSTIVRAGAVEKMVNILNDSESSVQEAAVTVFLSLSALDANKHVIGSSGAVPLIVKMLKEGSAQAKKDALGAMYNLSVCSGNINTIVESGALTHIVGMIDEPEVSVKALALIGHIAENELGRKAMANDNNTVSALAKLLALESTPVSQERALYVLMLIAHHSWAQRQTLISVGAVPTLLQLVLLGSKLSQQRASRILDYLRYDRTQARAVSAPLVAGFQEQPRQHVLEPESLEITKEREVVNQMVQQSLQRSMDRLVKRACLQSLDSGQSSSTRFLRNSSSSKSLQF